MMIYFYSLSPCLKPSLELLPLWYTKSSALLVENGYVCYFRNYAVERYRNSPGIYPSGSLQTVFDSAAVGNAHATILLSRNARRLRRNSIGSVSWVSFS
jgi:hypothetical protein